MSAPAREPVQERFSFRPGVYRARQPGGEQFLAGWHAGGLSLGEVTEPVERLLHLLAGPPATVIQLCDRVRDPAAVRALMARLQAGGWLAITVTHPNGRIRYQLVPERPSPGPPPIEPPPSRLVLSRFAVIRRDGDQLVMESPRAWCRLRFHDLAMVAALTGLAAAGSEAGGLEPAERDRLRRDLWWAGMAVPPASEEDTQLRLRQWAPHELWFHHRSRTSGPQYGGTWWAREEFEPLPARRPRFPGPTIPLRRTDPMAAQSTDPPLTAVLEGRRSIRQYDDDHPLTVDQLAEFLYRCARNRELPGQPGVTRLSRPYPAGGSLYELEVYPVVRRVAGLDPGMYHYDPQEHQLEQVTGRHPAVRRLLTTAALAADLDGPPQLLLVIAARFGRVMWKYEAMAYALILKHVGVLYQTMYLVATAMGLAPCGLGAGDWTAFAEATGLDPLDEGSVGEFLLGSRLPGSGPVGTR